MLVQMAKRRQIIELRCEMPSCYCHKGRAHFDPKSHPPGPWEPSPDHYPRLKSDGGHLDPWNVRLSHVLCNREDYGWRMRIRRMLEKGMSLEEIAEKLNDKGVRTPHGSGQVVGRHRAESVRLLTGPETLAAKRTDQDDERPPWGREMEPYWNHGAPSRRALHAERPALRAFRE